MRRIVSTVLLILALSLSVTLALSACQTDKCTEHKPSSPVIENEVAATCSAEGSYDEVVYCSVCDEELSREVKTLKKLNHTYENGMCTVCKEPKYSEGLEYTEVDGGYEVSGIGDCTDTDIVIPSTYNGLPVLSIGRRAFSGCASLTSVTIPDSVTSIGESAFSWCYRLTSITIGNSVTRIGESAFYYCYSLTSIVIPDSVTSIGESAFSWCYSLTSIVIPDSVTSIGHGAFSGCYKLVEVINHSSLNISVGSSENGYVAYYAIEVHTGESKIVNKDDYLFYTYGGVNYLLGYVGNYTALVLPENYNGENYEIYNYAFYSCDSLTSIVIPDSVTSIGESAFSWCYSLTSIVIPDSVTSIGHGAFSGCSKLVEVINHSSLDISVGSKGNGYVAYYAKEVHKGESKIVNKDDYLFYTYGGVNYLLGYVGNYTALVLPENYNGENYEIYNYAFYSCDSLTSIVIPDSVTSIGMWAFSWCTSLTSVTIPDSVTNIGDYAFYQCYSLTSVVIPDSVTSIGMWAFSGCYRLTSVTIPDSVTNIGDYAFYQCYRLTSIVIPDSVTSIGESAFSWCYSLTSIVIPDSVTSIGHGAFSGCYKLVEE